jgi:hypothetical protein
MGRQRKRRCRSAPTPSSAYFSNTKLVTSCAALLLFKEANSGSTTPLKIYSAAEIEKSASGRNVS